MGVSIGLARRPKESAEFAVDVANIRGIEVAIDVEVSRAPMPAATNCVGKFAEPVEIIGGIKSQAVFERKPLAGFDSAGNLIQSCVVRKTHRSMDLRLISE